MGPRPHQSAALPGEMRQLHLEPAFARPRPFAEDFENKRGAVEHLRLPVPLEIALLDRRKLGVDDDHFGFEGARFRRDLIHLAAADQRGGSGARQRHDVRGDHLQADSLGQPDRLGQPRLASRSRFSVALRDLGST